MKKHIVGGLILPELAPKNDQRYPEPPVRFIQESVRDFFLEACVDRLNHLVKGSPDEGDDYSMVFFSGCPTTQMTTSSLVLSHLKIWLVVFFCPSKKKHKVKTWVCMGMRQNYPPWKVDGFILKATDNELPQLQFTPNCSCVFFGTTFPSSLSIRLKLHC